MFSDYTATGCTHLQQSGTGAIEAYYNYLRVIPVPGPIGARDIRWTLADEAASPGYYRADLAPHRGSLAGGQVELTVVDQVACHRYRPARPDAWTLALDISCGGLDCPGRRVYPTAAEERLVAENSAEGFVEMQGLRIYFAIQILGRPGTPRFWVDRTITESPPELSRVAADRIPFGVCFERRRGEEAVVLVAVSLRGTAAARGRLEAARSLSAGPEGSAVFDAIRRNTGERWRDHLQAIEIQGGTAEERVQFTTALYNSCRKPADTG